MLYKGFRRFVYDTHVSLGIYAFVFLFLMSTMGPVFSFEWYWKGMSKLLGQKAESKELIIKKEDKKLMTTKNRAFETHINKHVNSQSASMQDSLQSKVGSHGNKKKKNYAFQDSPYGHLGWLVLKDSLCYCSSHRWNPVCQWLLYVV